MLVQLNCDPRQIADISLEFDDGTKKYVTLRPGLYAEFTYLKCGIVNTVQGKVIGVYAPPSHRRPCPNPHIYTTPPSVVCPPPERVMDERERRLFITVETQTKTVDIEIMQILDVRTVFENVRTVSSPDDETQIQLIRNNKGMIEFSLDGTNWVTVTMIDEGIDTKVEAAVQKATAEYAAKIEELTTKVTELEEKLNATSGDKSTDGTDTPSQGTGEDQQKPSGDENSGSTTTVQEGSSKDSSGDNSETNDDSKVDGN